MDQGQLVDRLSVALLGMIRRAEEAQDSAARHQGIHPTDFRCLGYLAAARGPISPKDVIAHLGLTSGAATALLDRLEAVGFIRRDRNPDDRRSVLIVLDEAAAASPIALHRKIEAEYAAAIADFSEAELGAITLYLERVQRLSRKMNEALYRETGPAGASSKNQQKNTN